MREDEAIKGALREAGDAVFKSVSNETGAYEWDKGGPERTAATAVAAFLRALPSVFLPFGDETDGCTCIDDYQFRMLAAAVARAAKEPEA